MAAYRRVYDSRHLFSFSDPFKDFEPVFPGHGRSGLEVSAFDCGVRGPRLESHRGLCCVLSRQPLRYAALGTGCAPMYCSA